jgi:hypothetical protein
MEINAKLIRFKSEVVPHLGTIASGSNDLLSSIKNFSDINSHGISEIKDNFQSQGMDQVTSEIAYLSDVTTKVYQSIGSELNSALTKCQSLATGIGELEKLLETYNDELSKYNSALQNSKNKTADKSAVNAAEAAFKAKEEALLAEHDALLALDGSLTMLSAFSTPADTGTLPADAGSSSGDDTGTGIPAGAYAKYIYEENGIIYQKVMPVWKGNLCDMGTSYTVVYNKSKMLAADQTAGSQIIQWLTDQMNGKNIGSKLYEYNKGKVTIASASGIGKVMDIVLTDTYKANNCKTVGDYAAVAAMTMGVGPINLHYGGGKGGYTDGVENLLKSGATLDCIGFVSWCYHQGVYRTGSTDNTMLGCSMTPLNIMAHHSKNLATMSQAEKESLPPGTVLSKKVPGNYHVGVVVGYTTINGKKHILVAQSSGNQLGGSYIYAYDVNSKFGPYDGGGNWMGASTPDMMTTRITKGSTGETRVA